MRIIAGSNKGTKLFKLEGQHTRPTLDRIKETVFNILQSEISDCVFLDLFSGSGAIGIEALSRGAKKSVFIDNFPECIEIINKNLVKTRLMDFSQVINTDVVSFLKNTNEKFDIIFIDPPYQKYDINSILNTIIEKKIIKENGFIIVEQDFRDLVIETLNIYRIKKFSKSNIIIYKNGG